jgi:adenosylcobinamide-phosphate synthase
VEHRPVLNSRGRAVGTHDVERAVRLSKRVTWLALGVCAGARLLMSAPSLKGAQLLKRGK